MPHVQVLHEKYADNPNVVIFAMNVGDENDKAEKYWASKEYTFPTLHDADDLAGEYGVKGFPSSIMIGPDGTVMHASIGSLHEMEELLEEALREMEGKP